MWGLVCNRSSFNICITTIVLCYPSLGRSGRSCFFLYDYCFNMCVLQPWSRAGCTCSRDIELYLLPVVDASKLDLRRRIETNFMFPCSSDSLVFRWCQYCISVIHLVFSPYICAFYKGVQFFSFNNSISFCSFCSYGSWTIPFLPSMPRALLVQKYPLLPYSHLSFIFSIDLLVNYIF